MALASQQGTGCRAQRRRPQLAYRLRRDNWPDTPLPPEFPAGQNPPDGAIIDYYLARDAAVTLDIATAGGTLVRHYSSSEQPGAIDEKEINVPMYWARPPQMLSAAKGMHRFVWDLRYAAPGADQRDFPISAIYGDTPLEPLGVFALPGIVFIAPLILIGFPLPMIGFAHGVNLVYQFWIHTETIDRFPRWFEAVMNTPSHHRVHHATNPRYLDSNYAGVFIVWDKMFGTFVAEREDDRPRYGIVKNLGSFNPLKVATHEWIGLARDLAGSRSLREVGGYLFAPPGWSPDGSRDTSGIVLAAKCQDDPRYRYIGLSRNFGHQIAISAGMDAAVVGWQTPSTG